MFSSLLTTVEASVRSVDEMVGLGEVARAAVATGSPGGELGESVVRTAPNDTEWRLYDHCAAVMRLYAIYEQFVTGAVGVWLSQLPDLYGSYETLPEPVRNAYRVGTAEILGKHGGDRYAHLTEDQVIRGLADGLAGLKYVLQPDAFLTDDRNLRSDRLKGLLSHLGVRGGWDRMTQNRAVVRWETATRGGQQTLGSELSQLVQYRNEAAHGSVNEILSGNRLREPAPWCD